MSEMKFELSNWKDRYWELDRKYENLIQAIKDGNDIIIDKHLREYEFQQKAETDALSKWIKETIKQ